MEIICKPLTYLSAPAHPELGTSILELEIRRWRSGQYAAIIPYQGRALAIATSQLPESIPRELIDPTSHPFNRESLKPAWFEKPYSAWQCTRHNRFAFWIVRPALFTHLLPVQVA